MECAYGYGHYQYQCDACGAYGNAGDCETQAGALVFAHIPGALGMLYDAYAWSSMLADRLEKEPRGGPMAEMVMRTVQKLLDAIDAADPRRKERLREIEEIRHGKKHGG